MPDRIRYILALAVLGGGFYGACQFRVADEPSRSPQSEEVEPSSAVSSTASSPGTPIAPRQAPLAVLIDTERQQLGERSPQAEPSLQTLPGIARRSQKGDVVTASSTPMEELPPDGQTRETGQAFPPAAPLPERQPPAPAAELPEFDHREADPPLPELAAQPGKRFSLSGTGDRPSEPASDPGPAQETSPGTAKSNAPERETGEQQDVSEQQDGEQAAPEPEAVEQACPLDEQPDESSPRADAFDQEQVPGRHRIVEGDTLPKLAATRLGDSSRYLEIFRVNRDVLGDPRLLPIGVELRIPQGPAPAGDPMDTLKETPPDQGVIPSRASHALVEAAASDLEPIPPQSLPPPGFAGH